MAHLRNHNTDVVWWDNSSLYIRCPHCDKVHRHSFYGNYQAEHHHVPHCGNDGSYKLHFPSDGLYEIDKTRGLYVRAGADPTEYFAQFDSPPRVDVSDKHKWTEAKEEVAMDQYHRNKLELLFDSLQLGPVQEVELCNRLEMTVSDMIQGRLQAVRAYLETSDEKDIFLHGVEAFDYHQPKDDKPVAHGNLEDNNGESSEPSETTSKTSGETALHMAACEMYPEMVKLLLDFGAEPNAKTVDGRTPLMEASIWGRLGNVKHLLSYGADKSVQCTRDGKRLRAVDFARTTLGNSEERYDRSGGEVKNYKEVTHERNIERAKIVRELDRGAADHEHRNHASVSNLHGFTSTWIRNGENIISMLAHFDVLYQQKTIGILFRGDAVGTSAFTHMAAMSGWGHQPESELNVRGAGRKWTNEVLDLCSLVRHDLFPMGDWDHGKRGQFYASHAEKQLIAYFVSKHIILPHENGVEKVNMLRTIQPPQRLPNAQILVSRKVCDDCAKFVRKVNEVLSLNIEVRGTKLIE